MDKLKILIACHKPSEVYSDDVYTPIQVGKALHPELDLGYICDNIGDNISSKNASYCELTAQYWGWKNIECEYIGLAHYRRFFEPVFTNNNIESLLGDNDIILGNPFHFACTVDQFWMANLIPEDVTILYLILKKYFPSDFKFAEQYLTNNLFYPCNMFVCRKELFDQFAQWQFEVLHKVEQVLPLSKYSRERRIFGYLGEALLPIYFFGRGYKVKCHYIVDKVGKIAVPHTKTKIKLKYLNWKTDFLFQKHRPTSLPISEQFMIGLQQDGIIEKL